MVLGAIAALGFFTKDAKADPKDKNTSPQKNSSTEATADRMKGRYSFPVWQPSQQDIEDKATAERMKGRYSFNYKTPDSQQTDKPELTTSQLFNLDLSPKKSKSGDIARPSTDHGEPTMVVNKTFDFDSYADAIGQSESGGDYTKVNKYGYLGKYQMGYSALVEAGYVKDLGNPKKNNNNANLKVSKNWLKGYSREKFLNDSNAQDAAFKTYTMDNLSALQNKGLVDDSTSPDQLAGMLGASHLIGVRGVSEQGLSGTDGNGTPASKWYSIAANSQKTASSDNANAVPTGTDELEITRTEQTNDLLNTQTYDQNNQNLSVVQPTTSKSKPAPSPYQDNRPASMPRNIDSSWTTTNNFMNQRGND